MSPDVCNRFNYKVRTAYNALRSFARTALLYIERGWFERLSTGRGNKAASGGKAKVTQDKAGSGKAKPLAA